MLARASRNAVAREVRSNRIPTGDWRRVGITVKVKRRDDVRIDRDEVQMRVKHRLSRDAVLPDKDRLPVPVLEEALDPRDRGVELPLRLGCCRPPTGEVLLANQENVPRTQRVPVRHRV